MKNPLSLTLLTVFLVISILTVSRVHAQSLEELYPIDPVNEFYTGKQLPDGSAETSDSMMYNGREISSLEDLTLDEKEKVKKAISYWTTAWDKVGEKNKTKEYPTVSLAVVKHIKGRHGISFTHGEQSKEPRFTDEEVKKYSEQYVETIEAAVIEKATRPDPLPDCEVNESSFNPIGKAESDDPKIQSNMEFLVVHKKLLPEEFTDYKSYFGHEINVVRVDEKTPQLASMLKPLGATCVPTRYRMTEYGITHHTGKNALKNYTKNPKGELYPLIAKLWKSFENGN